MNANPAFSGRGLRSLRQLSFGEILLAKNSQETVNLKTREFGLSKI